MTRITSWTLCLTPVLCIFSPKCDLLPHHLQALQALSVPSQSIRNLDNSTLTEEYQLSLPNEESRDLDDNNTSLIYGNDVDSVDVAVRVAMVNFFTSADVLGDLEKHTRTLRLYPRPVVALQKGSFLKSRCKPSEFVMALAESQACIHWCHCPMLN